MAGVRAIIAAVILAAVLAQALQARAQTLQAPEPRVLIVGTKVAPPFAMKAEDGTWRGISIDLWRRIASQTHLRYRFQETTLKGLTDGVAEGSLDVAVAALTVTAPRDVVAGIGWVCRREPDGPGWRRSQPETLAVPFKHHAEHRHHIPRPRYRVTNRPEYEAALRRRGSLTVWFTDEAIAAWRAEPRTTPGGQPHYSALAITTALTMRTVFGLALRQTEGLIGSIVALLGLALAGPCCTGNR